jgi:hypothetical protein
MRCLEDTFNLDVQGFEAAKIPSHLEYTDFQSEQTIMKDYYEECETILKKRFHAHRVHIFDHMLRKANATLEPAAVNEFQRLLRPALDVHVGEIILLLLDIFRLTANKIKQQRRLADVSKLHFQTVMCFYKAVCVS